MVDQIAVVTFTSPISSTTLDITSPSITEPFSAAILIYSRETDDDTTAAHAVMGIGFVGVDGSSGTLTQQVSVSCQVEDGVTLGQNGVTLRDQALTLEAAAGDSATPAIQAEFDSAQPGGVRINFTTVAAGPVRTKGVAILFAGLAKAAVGACTFIDSAISNEEVGVSPFWEPDLVVFRSSDNVVNGNTTNGTVALGFAINRSPIKQVSSYICFDDGVATSDSDGYIRSDACSSGFIGETRADMDRFAVTSFNSTGFAAQAAATAGINSPQANYLALKFTDPDVSLSCTNQAVTSGAGVKSFTGPGFRPTVVLGMSTLIGALDTLTDGATASCAGLFAFSVSNERAYTVSNLEGVSTAKQAKSRQGDHAVLTLDHTNTVAQQAELDSMTATGFDLNFSTATAGFLTYLAIGLPQPASVLSETEDISDEVVAFLSRSLVVSDTVEISESDPLLTTFDVTTSDGPQGTTFEPGAERGTSLSAGSEAGTVF